jgi:uncharacterized HAD superfamily protein
MPSRANKPTIAVDIDDVIFPLVPDLIEYVDREHAAKLTPEDFKTYMLEDIWPTGTAEGEIVFENYKNQVTTEVAPIKGAAEALHKLSDSYHLIIMTSRDTKVEPITRQWLNRHFPEVFREVHLLGNRKDSVTWRTKAEVCQELGVFCLVDDSLKHLTLVHEAGIKTILFGNYAWNRAEELPEGMVRVNDWQGVLRELDAA